MCSPQHTHVGIQNSPDDLSFHIIYSIPSISISKSFPSLSIHFPFTVHIRTHNASARILDGRRVWLVSVDWIDIRWWDWYDVDRAYHFRIDRIGNALVIARWVQDWGTVVSMDGPAETQLGTWSLSTSSKWKRKKKGASCRAKYR